MQVSDFDKPAHSRVNNKFGVKKLSSPGRSDLRFLVRHAMDRAQTCNHVGATNADRLACRKQLAYDSERFLITRIVEDWHENHFIGDIKIGVAGRQARSLVEHRVRRRQSYDIEPAAVMTAGSLEALKILLQRSIIRVFWVACDSTEHGSGIGEARNVVNV